MRELLIERSLTESALLIRYINTLDLLTKFESEITTIENYGGVLLLYLVNYEREKEKTILRNKKLILRNITLNCKTSLAPDISALAKDIINSQLLSTENKKRFFKLFSRHAANFNHVYLSIDIQINLKELTFSTWLTAVTPWP